VSQDVGTLAGGLHHALGLVFAASSLPARRPCRCKRAERSSGQGLDAHLRKREAADYRARGPGGGGFSRAAADAAAARLAIAWPGVRHALVPDAAAAAEHILGLTKALAVQPYKAQVALPSAYGEACPRALVHSRAEHLEQYRWGTSALVSPRLADPGPGASWARM